MAAHAEPGGGAPVESALLRNQAALVTVQDCLDLVAAAALQCCCRLAAEFLDDPVPYEASARRRALIGSIPPYVAFALRTEDEARVIALHPAAVRAPEVPAEVLELAARAGLPSGGPPAGAPPGALGARRALGATRQARLTWYFSRGIAAYEAKALDKSERFLSAALELAPEDDVILCRLADTCYARCAAASGEAREALEARTLELYREAVRVNPASSLGHNGLSLFQDGDDAKRRYLLRAVALDRGNAYALTNLAMRLLDDDEGMGEVCLALLKRALAINPNLFYARPTIAGLHLQFARTARTRREVAAQLREARAVLAEHVGRRPEDTDSGRLLDQLVKALEMFDDQTAQAP